MKFADVLALIGLLFGAWVLWRMRSARKAGQSLSATEPLVSQRTPPEVALDMAPGPASVTVPATAQPRARKRRPKEPPRSTYLFTYTPRTGPREQRRVTMSSVSCYNGQMYLNGSDADRMGAERSFKATRVRGKFVNAETGEIVAVSDVVRGLPLVPSSFGSNKRGLQEDDWDDSGL